ncbi:unnamed protein product [Prunus brigantina]
MWKRVTRLAYVSRETCQLPLWVTHLAYHKASKTKFYDLGLLVVVRCQLLLVNCNSNNNLLSFYFKHVKVDFHLLAVLVKTGHFNAHGRNCDVQEDDHFGLFDAILCKECGDLLANEFCAIVDDHKLRAGESADDVNSR